MKPTLTLIPIALLLASLAVLPAAEFPAGFSVGSDAFGPIVRVNVETIRDWSKVPGVKRFIPVPPAPGQTLPSHAVISNLKDVDGDGRIDVFCRLNETPYSHVARFDARGKQV